MANTDAPYGFKPVRQMGGTIIPVNRYLIASDESSDIFRGDPVTPSGTAVTAATGGEFEGMIIMTLATAGTCNPIAGIVQGFRSYQDLTLNYYDASAISTLTEVWVYDSPYTVFRAQEDSDSSTIAAVNIGLNVNVALDTAGNTTTGVSGAELDSSSVATGATLQCKILGLHKDAGGNNEIAANAEYDVLINNHIYAPNSAGV
jgi:hypothetical protein